MIDRVKPPKNRDESDTPHEEQQKKLPNFIKSESHTEKQPVHDRREAPVVSAEKREPEVRQPEERKARSEVFDESKEVPPKCAPGYVRSLSGG